MDGITMLGLSLDECCELAKRVGRTPALRENHNANRVPNALRMHRIYAAHQVEAFRVKRDGSNLHEVAALCERFKKADGALAVYYGVDAPAVDAPAADAADAADGGEREYAGGTAVNSGGRTGCGDEGDAESEGSHPDGRINTDERITVEGVEILRYTEGCDGTIFDHAAAGGPPTRCLRCGRWTCLSPYCPRCIADDLKLPNAGGQRAGDSRYAEPPCSQSELGGN